MVLCRDKSMLTSSGRIKEEYLHDDEEWYPYGVDRYGKPYTKEDVLLSLGDAEYHAIREEE